MVHMREIKSNHGFCCIIKKSQPISQQSNDLAIAVADVLLTKHL